MQRLKGRDPIMGLLGSLIDEIDDYTHWVDVKGQKAELIDRQFSEGLQFFINDLTKFYYSWEERY